LRAQAGYYLKRAPVAVTVRETNGWKWPLFMVGYLFALARLQ
jgi:hypothetical protein